jgi:anti-anti-sigma regulatory factor
MNDTSIKATSQVPLSAVKQFVVAHLMDNFDEAEIDALESRLLTALSDNRRLRGVIFNFSEVITTDPQDLRRLQEVFTAIKLLGGRIGLCGINPGLAAVIVTTQLNFHREVIGSDLDDVTASLLQR